MPQRLAITGEFQVEILEYEVSPPGAHQVWVETELASGKHGTTMGMFDNRAFVGQKFDQELRLFVADSDDNAQRRPTRESPWNLGTTGVGSVTAVGEAVTRFKVGDRVFGLMDVRQVNTCHEEQLWLLGDIDPYVALCVEPAYVAFHCARESHVRYGDTVVVIGLGALGLLAAHMTNQSGAEIVIAIDPLASRRALAMRYGADHALNPFEVDAALEVHHLTDGKGVDVAIELAGVYPALQTAIRSVRVGGTVCSAGFYQGESQGLWLGREWHHNRLNMIVPHGCGWGHPPRDYPLWDSQRAYRAIVSMMRKGRLAVPGLVNLTLSLEEGAQIFEIIRNREDEVIKFAIDFTQR